MTLSELAERARIRALGQDVPEGVSFSGPDDYVSQDEQDLSFPRGLPDEGHRGGYSALAALSRKQDMGDPNPQAPKTETEPEPPPTAQPTSAGPRDRSFMTSDPAAFAKADRAEREVNAQAATAKRIAKLVKTLATMGYGAAAGAAGGAAAGGAAGGATAGYTGATGFTGAAPVAGEAAGAAASGGAGSSMLSNFMGGGQQGGGGGILGRIANMGGGGGGGEGGGGGMMGGGGGMGGGMMQGAMQMGSKANDAVMNAFRSHFNRKRLAALQAEGMGPFDAGLIQTGNRFWTG